MNYLLYLYLKPTGLCLFHIYTTIFNDYDVLYALYKLYTNSDTCAR